MQRRKVTTVGDLLGRLGPTPLLCFLVLALGGCDEPARSAGGASGDDAAGLDGDAALPGDDAAPPDTDAARPTPDASGIESDAADPDPDAAEPDPDAAEPRSDAAHPRPDAAEPDPDAAVPEPDLGPDPPIQEGPAVYPSDRTLSPLTSGLIDRLRDLRDAHPELSDDVFAKVGDSGTVSRAFLHCFGGDRGAIDLDGRDELWPTIDLFRDGDANGTDPFRRESEAAVVGWSALHPLEGDPSPLDRELTALRPRFAVVMYGTNDIERGDIDRFAGDLLTLADRLLSEGVIPVFSSVMPRDDNPESDAQVPSYNGVIRGVAQGRQVPFIDLHRELLPLPAHGLGPDQLHPGVYRADGLNRPCDFTRDGLQFGYNWRNLLTIQSLDRLVRTVVEGDPAPDRAPAQRGTGAVDAPFEIESLPFTDLRDTTRSPHRNLDGYPGCDRGQNESGPEYVYRFQVREPTTIRAWVLDRGDVDIDLHLLGDPRDGDACVARDHRVLVADLAPGTWWFVLDSFVSGGDEKAGEYLFVVVAEE